MAGEAEAPARRGPPAGGAVAAPEQADQQQRGEPPTPLLPDQGADVFDSPNFNVTAFIRRVDGEILAAVRQQSTSGSRARADLGAARGTIEELLGRIREIQRKAEQSELMVQEICRDIRKLDHAKKHLTATITALRRLSMLLNAIGAWRRGAPGRSSWRGPAARAALLRRPSQQAGRQLAALLPLPAHCAHPLRSTFHRTPADQLQLAVERHEYAEAAQLLEAVQQLASHFQSYAHIPKVAELKGRLAALEKSLHINVLREFELLGEEAPSPLLLERLRSCCLVVEALGYQARDELIDAVCRREMGVYTQIFATIGDTARLERTVNRYKWLLKRLEARRPIWDIFPPGWHVPQLLCIMFCNITKTQLAEVLDLRSGELAGQVDGLLKAVEATNIFEAEMARRFEGVSAAPEPSDDGEGAEGGAGADDSTPASRVRARYERIARERQRAAEDASPERRKEQEHATSAAVARTNFLGSISSVFAPYLSVYVEQVERELMWSLDQLMREETWQPLSTDLPVLRSSNALVEALKKEMRECVSRVTRGRALLELAGVFGRVYRAYAARLAARLPKTASGAAASQAIAALGTTDWHVRLGEDDISTACLIVSTAEHCQEMVRQLARAVAARLELPELGARLDMGDEEGEFQAVITQCLGALLLGVETRLEAGLAGLLRVNWAGVEAAGDQSEYVGAVRAALAEGGARLGAALPPNYFRFFCDKLVRSFAPRLHEAVFRCRKISDVGCQQMRLDVEVIKTLLSDLGKEGGHLDAAGQAAFAAEVHAQLGRAEAVLKVVGSPPEGMVDTFFELLPNGSPSDFQRIAELKARAPGGATGGAGLARAGGRHEAVMRRQDYQDVLLQFNRRMGRPMLSGQQGAAAAPDRPAAASFKVAAGIQPPPPAPRQMIKSKDQFYRVWREFMESRGLDASPLIFNRNRLDLHKLYKLVQQRGGSAAVTETKSWARVGRAGFNPPASMTDLSFQIKRAFNTKLLEFEKAIASGELAIDVALDVAPQQAGGAAAKGTSVRAVAAGAPHGRAPTRKKRKRADAGSGHATPRPATLAAEIVAAVPPQELVGRRVGVWLPGEEELRPGTVQTYLPSHHAVLVLLDDGERLEVEPGGSNLVLLAEEAVAPAAAPAQRSAAATPTRSGPRPRTRAFGEATVAAEELAAQEAEWFGPRQEGAQTLLDAALASSLLEGGSGLGMGGESPLSLLPDSDWHVQHLASSPLPEAGPAPFTPPQLAPQPLPELVASGTNFRAFRAVGGPPGFEIFMLLPGVELSQVSVRCWPEGMVEVSTVPPAALRREFITLPGPLDTHAPGAPDGRPSVGFVRLPTVICIASSSFRANPKQFCSTWTALLLGAVLAHVAIAPYTKVEESFNLQATHDVLFHGSHIERYDHLDFPGVVPRTFLGALAVAAAAAPVSLLARLLDAPKLVSLFAVRLALGCLAVASFTFLRRCVAQQFGPAVGAAFMLITALQFHLPFYASRTLPNTLALLLTNAGLGCWLLGARRPCAGITLLTAAAVVFRGDVLLLLAPVGLHMLASRAVSVPRGLACGVAAVAASLAASVVVDSLLWRRWLWPEGEVLYFNTVLNRSHEWGVYPWPWYFTSALPRALHAAYPLALLGAALERRARQLLAVALAYVLLYSNLGHKEVRFLFPVLPLWNLCAACALHRLWVARGKSAARGAALAATAALLAAGLALTAATAAASRHNYPGGAALARLHALAAGEAAAAAAAGRPLAVHIAVLPAQTGVSRFGEAGAPWTYSKQEGLTDAQLATWGFDYLLSDRQEIAGFSLVEAVPGFQRFALAGASLADALRGPLLRGRPPLRVVTAPRVYILRREVGPGPGAGGPGDAAAAA
eukprot:scaffold20.g7688.t1